MECKGFNGTILATEQSITITHSGLAAKGSGLAVDVPRVIPLQAISDVRLKEATRLINGHITLGVGGNQAANLGMQAASNPDTVMFRHKNNAEFKKLHDWLTSVIEHNRTAGIDPSAVTFDAAAPTRLERMQAKQDELRALSENSERGEQLRAERREQVEAARAEKLAEKIGGERPDVVAAAARMGWRLGGNRELKKLTEHLYDAETVKFIAQGTYEGDQGILVLTDTRLLFLFHGVMRQAKEDFPLRLISSVKTKAGLGTGEIQVYVSGNTASISQIIKTDLTPLADAIRTQISLNHSTPAPASAPSPAPATDAVDQLRKLAELHAAGVLTDAEFASKKAELLDRI